MQTNKCTSRFLVTSKLVNTTAVTALLVTLCTVPGSPQSPADRAAVEQLIQTEQKAWNAGDTHLYSSVFQDDADFINIRGQVFSGKSEIEQRHAMLFAGPFKGSAISITVRQMKTLAPGLVLCDTDQAVSHPAFLPPGIPETSAGMLVTHMKYIAVKNAEGDWKFVSAQNTAVLPHSTAP